MRKLFRPLAVLVVVLVFAAAAVVAVLVAALPRRGGEVSVPGLGASVGVELDEVGVVRIRAATLADAFRAQGFVHAQERFFQMDLGRRSAAGELAALAGAALLPLDRERRVFQLRKRARRVLESLPERHRAWLAAYADGVNAGLADLGARPPEYWVLRARPEPWSAEDSVLIVLAFYTLLSPNHTYELPQAVMEASLPPALAEFLLPATSRFDRPLAAPPADPTGGYRPLPVPSAADVGTRRPRRARPVVVPPPSDAASNAWAIGAARSAHGAAIVAVDPHLDLGLPNVFHRAELHVEDRVIRGVGIPGVPGIVIGTSDDLAWGLTASYADQSDWVVVEPLPDDAGRYRVPGGAEPFVVERELIEIRGRAEPEPLDVVLTRWGPVVRDDGLGRPLALRATWLEPGGTNVDLLELPFAKTVREGLDLIGGWAGPSLGWVLADRDGRVAWTANGPIPARTGFDGSAPRSWADGTVGWHGYVPPPRVEGTADDVVYAANSRPLPIGRSDALGRIWMPAFRAKRIADRLGERDRFDEADLAALQLDTRAEAYDLVRDIALEVLDEGEADPRLAAVRNHIAAWNGRADASEIGFRLLHVYYRALLDEVLGPLLAPALAVDPGFVYRWPLGDEPLRRVLEERPRHLLPAGFADWPAFLRAILADTVEALDAGDRDSGPETAWGEANRLKAGHPLAGLPLLGALLELPDVPQPGSPVSVRVAEPSRGAVMRMVVSPARPERGILQLAGGQSGHFLSRHFDDQWRAWRVGSPAPLVAGEAVDAFTLEPPRDADQSNETRTISGGA